MIITLIGNVMYLLVHHQVLHIGSLYNRKEIKYSARMKSLKENKVKELWRLGAAVRGRLGDNHFILREGAGSF